jgi:hypothetical protein
VKQKKLPDENQRLAWHPAFVNAIRQELKEYGDALEILPEYQLTSEPLRIDCVIIKKAKGAVIKKNIGTAFREHNLLEYKSPDDYVSIEDFYKVYGYACLYAAIEKAPITDISLSFVESRYSGKLLKHLRDTRGYTVAETGTGIYTVIGDILPIQVIDSRQLSEEENLWLKGLDNRLGGRALNRVFAAVERQKIEREMGAYLDTVIRANIETIKGIQMSYGDILELSELFDRVGATQKWEARGQVRGKKYEALNIAKNMVNMGLSFETVVSATRLDPETVKTLYR